MTRAFIIASLGWECWSCNVQVPLECGAPECAANFFSVIYYLAINARVGIINLGYVLIHVSGNPRISGIGCSKHASSK